MFDFNDILFLFLLFKKKKFFFEISNEQDNDKYETGLQIRLNQRVPKYHLKIIVGQLK